MEYLIINTPEEFVDFGNFVYHENRVVCMEMKVPGDRYYPHTTQWTANQSKRGKHDPDITCEGYFGHSYAKKTILKLAREAGLEKEWKALKKRLEDEEDVEEDEEYQEFVNKLIKKVKPDSWDDISHIFDWEARLKYKSYRKIKLEHDLIVTNDMGCVNDDHRGSNHMAVDIDHLFEYEVTIQAGVYDVEQIMDIMWRIKGNKFDNNYEMFFTLALENVEFHGGQWYLNCGVDHGS